MGVIIGPTTWWINEFIAMCPVGSTVPVDGSRIFCKAGGRAWLVAPVATEVNSQWAGGQYNSTLVGEKCCICEWSGLYTRLLSCGFNPCEWFVPNLSQQQTGFNCRANWDSYSPHYWTSCETNSTNGCGWSCNFGGSLINQSKANGCAVRAMRCVTY